MLCPCVFSLLEMKDHQGSMLEDQVLILGSKRIDPWAQVQYFPFLAWMAFKHLFQGLIMAKTSWNLNDYACCVYDMAMNAKF